MRTLKALLALSVGLVIGQAYAATPEETIAKKLGEMSKSVEVLHVEKSPLAGLYLAELKGGQHIFVNEEVTHFINGEIYGVDAKGKLVNESELRREVAAAKEIAAIPEKDMIVYEAAGEKKAVVTVFSDPTCPYCKLFHKSIPDLNKAGIEVRYLAFPRMGLGSEVHSNMASAWCSSDRKAAISKLFDNESIPEVKCQNPVADQFTLGETLGVMGTPTIFLSTGKSMMGVQTADQILTELRLKK